MHLFALLRNKLSREWAAYLVYYLTTHENLSNWCVLSVQRILRSEKNHGVQHLKVLLALFKRLRPDLVPEETLPVKREQRALPRLSPAFEEVLETTRIRLNLPEVTLLPYIDSPQISVVSEVYPNYVQNCSNVTDVKSFLRTIEHGRLLTAGTNFESILRSRLNIIFVAKMTQDEKHLFHLFLKKSFAEAPLLSCTETKQFLIKTYQLYDLFHKDENLKIEHLLKKFLKVLNSVQWFNFVDEILPFIPKMQFKSYRSFFNLIMRPLYTVFCQNCNHQLTQCRIIETLSAFLYENYNGIAHTRETDEQGLPNDDFVCIIAAIKHLTRLLLNMEPASFESKYTALNAYDTILKGEQLVSMVGLDIVPVDAADLIPLTRNYVILEFYAKILEE